MRDEAVPEPEVIRTCAVLYRGEVFTGVIHSDALAALKAVHSESVHDDEVVSGYLTTTGRFVGRGEAALIAERNDQLRESVKRRWDPAKGLYSEDLKPEIIWPDRAA